MPDFERLARQMEVELASSAEQRAFAQGVHAGEDRARLQVGALIAGIAVVAVLLSPYIPGS